MMKTGKELYRFLGTLKNNKKLILLASIIDFTFFVLLLQLHIHIFYKVANSLQKLSENLAQNLQNIDIANTATIINTTTFQTHYHTLLWGIFTLLIGFFTLWTITKGINWYITHKITGNNISISTYTKRFLIITTTSTALFILILILFVTLLNHATFSALPLLNPSTAQILIFALLLTLHYTYTTSITNITNKHSYTTLPKTILNTNTIIIYLTSIIWYIITISTAMLLSKIHPTAGIGFAMIIIMPSMTISRILIIRKN